MHHISRPCLLILEGLFPRNRGFLRVRDLSRKHLYWFAHTLLPVLQCQACAFQIHDWGLPAGWPVHHVVRPWLAQACGGAGPLACAQVRRTYGAEWGVDSAGALRRKCGGCKWSVQGSSSRVYYLGFWFQGLYSCHVHTGMCGREAGWEDGV